MWTRVARRLLPEEVFEQIRGRIVRGEVAPGEALPAERALAEHLGVNRNAVREGLKRLQQAGLVAIQHGGQTRVLDFTRTAGLELLASLMIDGDGNVDTRVVRGVLELRTELSPVVGRLSAKRASRADVRAMREVVAKMRAADGDTALLSELALDFWAAVVKGTGNVALELAMNSLVATYGQVKEHLRHVLADELRATPEYDALVSAIAAHDADTAARVARAIASRGEAALGRITDVVDAAQRLTRPDDEPLPPEPRPRRKGTP